MANQRDPDKKRLQTWMYEKDIKILRQVADDMGMTLPDLLVKLTKELKGRNRKG